MRAIGQRFGLVVLLTALVLPSKTCAADETVWTFETDPVGSAPSDFSFGLTGKGRGGHWVVQEAADAPSGRQVLAQLDTDATDFRFPVAVVNAPMLQDLHAAVRCKMLTGRVDQACGLVVRYQDAQNYYVTRANALEGNVRLYHVVDGTRRQIAGWDGPVAKDSWHELRIDAQGDHLEVYWDGQHVLDAHDQTFQSAGKVGLWTKADSVTLFDDLKVGALKP